MAKAPVLSQDREHLLHSCIHKFYLRPERPSLAALVMEAGRSARPSGRRLQSVVPKRIQGQTHLRAQGAIEGHNLMRARLPSLTPFLSAVVPNKT
jgi:hypothetical protein